MCIVFFIWFADEKLMLLIDFEPYFNSVFVFFKLKTNLNAFIFLCLVAFAVNAVGFIINYLIFFECFNGEEVRVYWLRLALQFFVNFFLGAFSVFFIVNMDIYFVDKVAHLFICSTIAFSMVGLFFYVMRFFLIRNRV